MAANTSRLLGGYFLLAFTWSWLVAAPLAQQGQGIISGVPPWLHLLSAYGPLSAAVGATAVSTDHAGLAQLFSRVTHWRIGWASALLPPCSFTWHDTGVGW
ncbi:MAG: hypothetical protein IPM39_28725 [Chloroflexi bacterium]|nr:hypothetical protein [Chloroflexota bacterium]